MEEHGVFLLLCSRAETGMLKDLYLLAKNEANEEKIKAFCSKTNLQELFKQVEDFCASGPIPNYDEHQADSGAVSKQRVDMRVAGLILLGTVRCFSHTACQYLQGAQELLGVVRASRGDANLPLVVVESEELRINMEVDPGRLGAFSLFTSSLSENLAAAIIQAERQQIRRRIQAGSDNPLSLALYPGPFRAELVQDSRDSPGETQHGLEESNKLLDHVDAPGETRRRRNVDSSCYQSALQDGRQIKRPRRPDPGVQHAPRLLAPFEEYGLLGTINSDGTTTTLLNIPEADQYEGFLPAADSSSADHPRSSKVQYTSVDSLDGQSGVISEIRQEGQDSRMEVDSGVDCTFHKNRDEFQSQCQGLEGYSAVDSGQFDPDVIGEFPEDIREEILLGLGQPHIQNTMSQETFDEFVDGLPPELRAEFQRRNQQHQQHIENQQSGARQSERAKRTIDSCGLELACNIVDPVSNRDRNAAQGGSCGRKRRRRGLAQVTPRTSGRVPRVHYGNLQSAERRRRRRPRINVVGTNNALPQYANDNNLQIVLYTGRNVGEGYSQTIAQLDLEQTPLDDDHSFHVIPPLDEEAPLDDEHSFHVIPPLDEEAPLDDDCSFDLTSPRDVDERTVDRTVEIVLREIKDDRYVRFDSIAFRHSKKVAARVFYRLLVLMPKWIEIKYLEEKVPGNPEKTEMVMYLAKGSASWD